MVGNLSGALFVVNTSNPECPSTVENMIKDEVAPPGWMNIRKAANLICTGGRASREGRSSRSDRPGFKAKTPVEGFFASGGHFK